MKDDQIILISDGKEELATILFTHEVNNQKYVVFEFVESGEVSAARYRETDDGEGELLDIETEEEFAMLDELLEDYYDDLEEEEIEELDESN